MLAESIHYTEVADGKLIAIFQLHEPISPKAIALFSHVLNAQHIWANRILGLTPSYKVWDEHEVGQFEEISKTNFKLLADILKQISLTKELSYVNSKGDQFTSSVQDILFHVVNHSTYHRAQIATLFKADGITPPVTDYIMLKRDYQL